MIDSSLKLNGRITEIIITKERDKHAQMSITVCPDRMRDIQDLLDFAQIGGKVDAAIDGKFIMCGKIRGISGDLTYAGAAVTVLVVSDSILLDEVRKSRVFQSPEKSYDDIIKKLGENGSFTIGKEELKTQRAENVIIQNNETDYEFASRIAHENDTNVFVCSDENDKCEVIIGDNTSHIVNIEPEKIISIHTDISVYYEALDIRYEEYIELGTKVRLFNNEYVVVSLKTEHKDDTDKFFMCLERKLKEREKQKEPLELISLGRAKVADNKDPDDLGRIQVEFLETEDAINDKKIWISYINVLTAGEGGTFFIPDNDEIVEVIVQNGVCYAYGCVRTNRISEKIKNTDNKSLMLFDRTLVCDKDKITLDTGHYNVEIKEDDLTIKNGDQSILISKDRIFLGNEKKMIEINGNQILLSSNNKGMIAIKDNSINSTAGNSSIELENSNLQINVKGNAEITASKVNVK